MAAVKAHQRGGIGWATQAVDAGASGVFRRDFSVGMVASELCIA